MDLSAYQQRIQAVLETKLPPVDSELHEAMRYSVFAGGKRLRPALVYLVGEILGASADKLDIPACAIELIHTYSMIHDDLPAMDDDDLRRGNPTCHKAFNEAIAILVGDALQSLAFQLLAENKTATPEINLQMITVLASASGSLGMAGGQALDCQLVGKKTQTTELEIIYQLKTGALLAACVKLGALAAGYQDPVGLKNLETFGHCVGLAFQIQDDILDIVSSTATLGKQQGADARLNKMTYPALIGLETAKTKVKQLHATALQAVQELKADVTPLISFAEYLVVRAY